ncbi:MAG: diguanylate cyclase response regulator [Desulfobacterales bacterium RIFOXYA12_FULL_46_15]|nr:MAG: diguanylate cyclase response regulator [Desulfobacula sp. GWF2_41_7]OGR23142.1 MAG: diguanylate cyclase response regulator [Desulfobacterales bacterium RIFOXYA12_FULL_46_15]
MAQGKPIERRIQKTILVVDDTPGNIDMMLNILKEYDVIPATSGEEALFLLENETVDMILLDIMMPSMDGFEVCSRLKANEATREIPVIFITAKNDLDSIEKAYDAGGVDYVTKPFRPRELMARVKTHLHLREVIGKLDYLATHDSLTGLYNRRKFFELGRKLYNSSKSTVSAVIIDIDHFKRINDCHGHHSGDLVLKAVTKTIGALLPKQSVLGRVGGEEFAALIDACTMDDVKQLIDIIRITVSELIISIGGGAGLSCTISSGVARTGDGVASLDDLLKKADAALYEAKQSGRNRTIFRQSDTCTRQLPDE